MIQEIMPVKTPLNFKAKAKKSTGDMSVFDHTDDTMIL